MDITARERDRRWLPALLLLVAFLAGCGADPTGDDTMVVMFDHLGADAIIVDTEHRISNGGLPRGILWADTAYMYEAEGRMHVRKPSADLFDEYGRVSAHITGAEGDIVLETEYLVVRGDVVLTMPENNRRITTEVLNFDCNSNAIWSESPTTMVEDGVTLQGSGFRADCEMQNLEIENARGTGFRLE